MSPTWTDEEKEELERLWRRGATWRTWLAALPGRSWPAIRAVATERRLPWMPEGWCTVTEGARRAGFWYGEFIGLLAELGIRIRPHPRPSHTRGDAVCRRTRIVSWRVVEPALRRHLAARGETIAQAAARHALARMTLYKWARSSGEYASTGAGRTVRLPRERWDSIVARHARRCA